jgi:hypothetical protein
MAEVTMEMQAPAIEMEYAEAQAVEEPAPSAAEEEAPSEPTEPKGGLAKRFAARRAKRQSAKSGGGSLSDRLRGLTSESSETRT